MNIAIIGSGGDGAGMNMCLYEICKKLKKHNIVLFYRGFQGLIDNSIANYSLNFLKNQKEKGGIIIMYSGEKNIIKKHLRLNENYKLLREFVFNEKEERYVFVLTNS